LSQRKKREKIELYARQQQKQPNKQPNKQQTKKMQLKKKFKSRVYGGIIRHLDQETNTYEYAIVQGRATGMWSFPKGHSKPEESPLACAWREIEEETSISSEEIPIHEQYLKLGNTSLFVFTVSEKYPLTSKDQKEIMRTRWVSLDELSHLPSNLGIQQFVIRCKKM